MCFWPPDHSKCVFIEWLLFVSTFCSIKFVSLLWSSTHFHDSSLFFCLLLTRKWSLQGSEEEQVRPQEQERPGAKMLQPGWVRVFTCWQWGKAAVCSRENSKKTKMTSFHKSDERYNETCARRKEKRQNLASSWAYLYVCVINFSLGNNQNYLIASLNFAICRF